MKLAPFVTRSAVPQFPRRRILFAGILAGVALALPWPVHAQSTALQTWTWLGAAGNWSDVASWSSSDALTGGATTGLVFGGSASYAATDDIGNLVLNQLQFANTAGTVTLNGSPTTNALTFVMNPNSAALPSLSLTSSGSATVSTPITWGSNGVVTNSGSGTLLFNGSQTYTNGTKQTYVNAGTGTITLADAITYANLSSGSNAGLVLNLINNNSATGSFNLGNVGALNNTTINVGGTGTVRFSGSTGGDLFGSSTILNVLAGGTFDFNGNGETFGAFSGAGTIVTTVGLSPTLAGFYVFSGKITGTGGNLTVGGSTHTLTLSGSTSDYTGATSITAGTLIVAANAPSGSAGALGKATSDVLVGNTSGSNPASLLIGAAGVNIGRNVRVQSGSTGVTTVGGNNTSGTATYSGNVILGTNSGAAKGLTITAAPGGTVEFTGNLLRATSATGATDTVTVTGNGTVAFRGANTFTGTTTVNGGTLLLDDTINNGQKLSPTANLNLNGGSLNIVGNNSASSTETVSSLTLGNASGVMGGAGQIIVTSGINQNATLNVGSITHNTGSTVDFQAIAAKSGSGANNTAIITTTTANTSGILGAHATYSQNDWAVNDGSGKIVALAYSAYTTAFGSGLNTSLSAGRALPSGGGTTSTLRFTNTSAMALVFAAATNTLTLQSGGILMPSSVTGDVSIGTTSVRGVIATGTGELIVNQYSPTATLTINSNIGGNNVTISGGGAVTLTGANTYTGSTYINNGSTVTVTAAANLGAATADVTINGGTLALPSGTLGTLNAANRVITVGPSGATFNFTANQSMEGSGLAGTGTLTLTGTGTLTVGSSASTFTGAMVIASGTLKMNSAQFNNSASVTVLSGGTYNVEDDGVGTFDVTSGGRFVINGNGVNGNGAIRLSDQSTGTSLLDPTTTIDREVNLQTTSRIQVDVGTAANSTAQLILTGNVTGSGGLDKTGVGTLTLTARDNTFSGGTVIEAGTLSLNLGNDRLPTSTTVTLGTDTTSGVLQLNGYAQTVAGLSAGEMGAANAVISGSSSSTAVLTVNVASGTQTYTGTLGGTGAMNTHANNNLGFVKDGVGTMLLPGANSYNGSTTVAAGTLVLGDVNALGSGGVSLSTGIKGTTINKGATLDLNGQNNFQQIITLNGSGVGGAGALVNNSAIPASIGSGISSLSVSSVTTAGWSAGAAVAVSTPAGGNAASVVAQLGISAGSMTITNGGSGYGLSPVVTVIGGVGAQVTALVGVTSDSYAVTSGTTTYSVAPTVTLSNGATGVAVLDSTGLVIGITITNPGSSFTGTPTATFSGGTVLASGTNPTAAGNSSHFTITGLKVVNPGTGFTSVPVITISGGSGATVVGNDGSFVLNGFAVTDGGSGYSASSAPVVTVSGGSAVVTANVSAINLASDSAIGGTGDLTVNAPISGKYTLTKVGSGTLTLADVGTTTSNFTGPMVISAGIVRLSGSQLNNAASLTVAKGATYHVEADGVGTFDVAAGGRFVINGYGVGGNGAIWISDKSPELSLLDPMVTIDREVMLQTTSRIQVSAGTAPTSTAQLMITGNITGPGGLDKIGEGTLTLTGQGNTFSGGTMVEEGTLSLNQGNDRLPTNTMVTLGTGTTSGVLQLNGYAQTIAGLSAGGTGAANAVINGSNTSTGLLTVNVASGTQTYTGTLGGPGAMNTHANNNFSLVKDGVGTMKLPSANTYNGSTTVARGTLVLGNVNALGNGGASLASDVKCTTISAGATLDLNGQNNLQQIITLNGSGVNGAGALVNNSTIPASIGSGIASLSVSSVRTTGWSAGAAVAVEAPAGGNAASVVAQLGISAGSMTITSGGSGYGLEPVVMVNGGTGAQVRALVGVTAESYTVTSGTTTYSVAPTVTLSNGATGVAVLGPTGLVVGINIINPGSSFTGTPTATFSGGTVYTSGTNPTAAGNTSNFTITGLTVVNAGTGFTAAPEITIAGGLDAAVVGNDGNFVLNGFAVADGGSGYGPTSTPAVDVSGGAAVVTANVSAIKLASDSAIGGSGDLTINAGISGNYGFTKVGAGTLTLAGENTYKGATNINAGTVNVAGTIDGSASVNVGGSNPAILRGKGVINAGALNVLNKGTLAPDAGGSGLAIHGLTGSSAASVTFQSGSTFHLTLANSAGDGNAPLAADFSYLNLDHGGAVMIAPGSLLSITTGVVHTGDLFTVILNGGGGDIEGVFNNSTSTLVADSTYSFSSDGMAWYINYEYDGSLSFSASGINPTAFSQITGGNSVAILAMAPGVPGSAIVSEPSSSALVPEPGSCVSLLGGISLLLGLPRFRRRRS